MNHIETLRSANGTANTRTNTAVELDPEYVLIVDANNLAVEIDNEICKCVLRRSFYGKSAIVTERRTRLVTAIIHKFARDKYSKRFPELESLVVSPLEYVKTVKELKNNLDQAKNNETLQQFLTQATIMVVSVTASTTQGYGFGRFKSTFYTRLE